MPRWRKILLPVLLLPVLLAALWLWFLLAPDPLNALPARYLPLPVACSTRGCITSTSWHAHTQASRAFAAATVQTPPMSAATLTTLLRQHLTNHATLPSKVEESDAQRYREEILNLKDAAQVEKTTGLTITQYDAHVITPFLQQEALRQQTHVESLDELFTQLAAHRTIIVWPFSLGWDPHTASVTTNTLYVPAN